MKLKYHFPDLEEYNIAPSIGDPSEFTEDWEYKLKKLKNILKLKYQDNKTI